MRIFSIILFTFVFTAVGAEQDFKTALQNALEQAYSELRLPPSTRVVFDQEVKTEPMPFVSSLKTTLEGHEILIDSAKLKGFLNFSSKPFQKGVCVGVRANPQCVLCSEMASTLRGASMKWLDEKGFKSLVGPPFPNESVLYGDKAFEDYKGRAVEQGCEGVLYIEFFGQEKNLSTSAYFIVKEVLGMNSKKSVKSSSAVEAQKDLGSLNESVKQKWVSQLLSKQMVDLFSQLGSQSYYQSSVVDNSRGVRLRLTSVKDYVSFLRFKEAWNLVFQDSISLLENEMQPGSISFALLSSSIVDLKSLQSKLKLLSLDPYKLEIKGVHENELEVSIY